MRYIKPHSGLYPHDRIRIEKYTLLDLFNPDDPLFRSTIPFENWKDFFGDSLNKEKCRELCESKEYYSKRLVMLIAKIFFDKVCTDMIINNDTYTFTTKNAIRMCIGEKYKYNWKYKYRIEDDGKNFIPIMLLSNNTYRKCKVKYHIRLTRRWRHLLREETSNGHRYSKVKYDFL